MVRLWSHACECQHKQEHTPPPLLCFGVRVSALWVCPAWGAEACAREQMVVTWQEGSGGTLRARPNLWPWLFLPVVEGIVAAAAQCWRGMEGGQLLCCCSVAELYAVLQVDGHHNFFYTVTLNLTPRKTNVTPSNVSRFNICFVHVCVWPTTDCG